MAAPNKTAREEFTYFMSHHHPDDGGSKHL
jgi:hypothetical protein